MSSITCIPPQDAIASCGGMYDVMLEPERECHRRVTFLFPF